ncbi:DUF6653 family protein [Nonomuraea sp. NPDC059023]|uniref:DUF6653 family protein n=1 Tax=unclassified Nonomuraea TaxID=2593643 RepID=UPI00367B355A
MEIGLSDQGWKRHANPWSVWTRFAAIPLMILAIWSREWIGWWSLLPIGLVVVWLFVNPYAFPAVTTPTSWSSKGIYGEQLWLQHKSLVSADHRKILRLLIAAGSAGFALIGYGLVVLDVWPTVFGATLTVIAQLWRIDRMGLLYEERKHAREGAPPLGG